MSPVRSLRFDIDSDEYQIFRFALRRAARLRIRVVASEPINVLLLDRDQLHEYEKEDDEESAYTAKWGRQLDLDATLQIESGQWSLIIEGDEDPSVGVVELRA